MLLRKIPEGRSIFNLSKRLLSFVIIPPYMRCLTFLMRAGPWHVGVADIGDRCSESYSATAELVATIPLCPRHTWWCVALAALSERHQRSLTSTVGSWLGSLEGGLSKDTGDRWQIARRVFNP